MDRFDGLPKRRPWAIPLILLPGLGYLGPALLLDQTAAQMGGILGLAVVMLAIGSVLVSGRRGDVMGGRRIAGLALLGYIPAYLLTLVILTNHSEIPYAVASFRCWRTRSCSPSSISASSRCRANGRKQFFAVSPCMIR